MLFTELPLELQACIAEHMDPLSLDNFSCANTTAYAATKYFKNIALSTVKDLSSFLRLPLTRIRRYEWVDRNVHFTMMSHMYNIVHMEYTDFVKKVCPILHTNIGLRDYILSCLSMERSGNIHVYYSCAEKYLALKNYRLLVSDAKIHV